MTDRLGWVLLAAGLVAVAVGALPVAAAVDVGVRVWPVLAFLVLVKILADLFDAAGLFAVTARWAARRAGGRTWVLFAAYVVLCAVATALLSLDTTAVLMTPVALALARELELDPWPFALAGVWLANVASLAFPVANLTNLLAMDRLGVSTPQYVALLARPQAAVLVVAVGLLALRNRAALRGTYVVPAEPAPGERGTDRPAVATAAVLTIGLGAAVAVGAAPWLAAGVAAVVMVGVLSRRAPEAVRPRILWRLAPWGMVAFAGGLFLLVDALVRVAQPWLAATLPRGDGPAGLAGLAATSAVLANVVNNLPAYLGVEQFAGDPLRLVAVLLGVNAGPLVTSWGSLATLLWLRICRDRGLPVRPGRFALEGLPAVPLLLAAGVAALYLTPTPGG